MRVVRVYCVCDPQGQVTVLLRFIFIWFFAPAPEVCGGGGAVVTPTFIHLAGLTLWSFLMGNFNRAFPIYIHPPCMAT